MSFYILPTWPFCDSPIFNPSQLIIWYASVNHNNHQTYIELRFSLLTNDSSIDSSKEINICKL